MSRRVSVVLPCYQEGPTLSQSLRRIESTLLQLREPAEMILIDDASTDGTRDRARRFVAEAQLPVEVVLHERNRGRGATVCEGLAIASGDVVGFLDVDLEVGPEYIPTFVEAIRDGADMAIGRREYTVGPRAVHRYLASRAYAWLVRWRLGLPFADTEAGYKFFRWDVAQLIATETSDPGWFWDTEACAVALRKGLAVAEVPCRYERRPEKRSTVRLIPDTVAYLRALRRFRR